MGSRKLLPVSYNKLYHYAAKDQEALVFSCIFGLLCASCAMSLYCYYCCRGDCGNTGSKEKHLNLPGETVVTAGIVGLACRTFSVLYGDLDVKVG